jgi:hypothetical protein
MWSFWFAFLGLFTYHMIDLNRWSRVTLVNRTGRRSHWKTATNLRKSPEVNVVVSHCVGVFGPIIWTIPTSARRERESPLTKDTKRKMGCTLQMVRVYPANGYLNGNTDYNLLELRVLKLRQTHKSMSSRSFCSVCPEHGLLEYDFLTVRAWGWDSSLTSPKQLWSLGHNGWELPNR